MIIINDINKLDIGTQRREDTMKIIMTIYLLLNIFKFYIILVIENIINWYVVTCLVHHTKNHNFGQGVSRTFCV